MADYVWHQHYGDANPKEINPDSYPSIVAAFEESCNKFGDKVAFENMGVPMTFNELKKHSENFAAWIQNNTDLVPGDKIAIQMPNLLQYPICIYGSLLAGMVVVNVNPLYTSRE
ncbi:MAG: long-chain acyl-CoA synthetase, partial [Bacteroidia bacterium]